MDKLKMFFAELEKNGVRIDDKRMIASFKFAGRLSAGFAKGDAQAAFEEDDNYFYATFRALSMTSFPWQGLYLDFSKNGVLKKATKLLQGQTVYSNHNTAIENWLGVVVQSRWDDSTDIPAGINARLRLSKKWNEKIIDGIREGAIHSASADVMFEFAKSHPDLADFWFTQGEEVNGEIVRLIATKIISMDELSLVWQGADRFAKKLSLSKSDGDSGSGSDSNTDIQTQNAQQTNGGNNNMKLSRSMALIFGIALAKFGFGASVQEVELDAGMQDELLADLTKTMKDERAANEKKQQTLDAVFGKEFNGNLLEAAKKLTLQVEAGAAHLKDVKAEAVKFAKLVEGKEELNPALAKAIENASLEDAKAFLEEYRVKAGEKFPAKCAKCGAAFTRGSAKKGEQSTEAEEEVKEANYAY